MDQESKRSELCHVVCCGSDAVALCGLDVSEDEWVSTEEEITCVVCHDLADKPCGDCNCPLAH